MTNIMFCGKSLSVDLERGFDVMRGNTVVAHSATYEGAKKVAASTKGAYVRYFVKK